MERKNNIYNDYYNDYNNDYSIDEYDNYESRLNNYNNHEIKQKKRININLFNILFIIFIIALLVFGFIIIRNLLKSYTVNFYLNGADVIDHDIIKCKSNVRGECFLTLPNTKRYDSQVLGYSKNANSKEAEYVIGQEIEIFENMDLYVISKKINTLNIDSSNIDTLDAKKDDLTCITYNLDKMCSVKVPMFNKAGYQNVGYTEDKNNKGKIIRPGEEISADKTLYPYYSGFPLGGNIETKSSFALNKAYVDIEKTCPDSIASHYTEYIKKIEKNWPFLFHYQKVIFHGADNFHRFSKTKTSVAGITFVVGDYQDIQSSSIKCETKYDSYLVIVHELSHSFDQLYYSKFNKLISSETDVKDLYNKYKKISKHPLSDYAFSATHEFFAELMAFYYLNYVDTSYNIIRPELFYRGNFPDDLKKVAEKYICIGKNNFDLSKCS